MRRATPWFVFLALFYATWLGLVWRLDLGARVLAHWPVALAMLFGSYIAGSTPMGGGAVAFPVLVFLLHEPPVLGRDFSLAIQSIGMTSASILILCRRTPLYWNALWPALAGTAVGTPIGLVWVAPLLSGQWIKLVFAVLWASFGLLHVWHLRQLLRENGERPAGRHVALLGGATGLAGGVTISSITGNGVDMLFYVGLVLLLRADARAAIPSSVVLMAFTSVLGLLTRLLSGDLRGDAASAVFGHWLAAAPVVALGAPLGALAVSRMPRKPTLVVVAGLCLLQFGVTCYREWTWLGVGGVVLALAAVLALNLLYAWGSSLTSTRPRLAGRRTGAPPGFA